MKYHPVLDDIDFQPIGWYASEKFDGMFARWYQGHLYSKNKLPIETSEAFKRTMPPDFILEGEWMRGRQQFYVFDGYRDRHEATTMPFKDRLAQLLELKQKYGFHLLVHKPVATQAEWAKLKQKAHQRHQMEGYVLRHPDSTVEFGKRSRTTLKWKPWRKTTGQLLRWVKTKSGESAELKIHLNNGEWTMKLHAVRMKKSEWPVGSTVPIVWNGYHESGKPEFIKFDG